MSATPQTYPLKPGQSIGKDELKEMGGFDEHLLSLLNCVEDTNFDTGVFPFYPAKDKTDAQALIESATVNLLNRLWVEKQETRRVKAELNSLRLDGPGKLIGKGS
jgi:hypothetical protein